MVWITLPTERSSIHFLATQVLLIIGVNMMLTMFTLAGLYDRIRVLQRIGGQRFLEESAQKEG